MEDKNVQLNAQYLADAIAQHYAGASGESSESMKTPRALTSGSALDAFSSDIACYFCQMHLMRVVQVLVGLTHGPSRKQLGN